MANSIKEVHNPGMVVLQAFEEWGVTILEHQQAQMVAYVHNAAVPVVEATLKSIAESLPVGGIYALADGPLRKKLLSVSPELEDGIDKESAKFIGFVEALLKAQAAKPA